MQEKDSTMRINQLVSDYLTLSPEQGWTLVKDQPKLAIKHLLPALTNARRTILLLLRLLESSLASSSSLYLVASEESDLQCARRDKKCHVTICCCYNTGHDISITVTTELNTVTLLAGVA
jgi:hypothetical protein